MSLFITGTDTGVGKTQTAVQLLRLLRAAGTSCAGMKPICCGDRGDAELLLAAGSDNIEQILAAFRALQNRVEHVIVEGVGGWMVPIRSDYLISDLAAEMKLPVLVVTQNRLGCLNHTALTVRSVTNYNLPCLGVVLTGVPVPGDVAASTNADILKRILNVPLLVGLGENLMELPGDWRLMLDSARDLSVLT